MIINELFGIFFKKESGVAFLNLNNTTWSIDSIALPVTILSAGFGLTATLLHEEILKSKEEVKILISYGLSNRSLGGNYGQDGNKSLRPLFLNTEALGFNGTNLKFRLELSKFYGEVNISNFAHSGNIAGFSGTQSVIRIGLVADVKLPTNSLLETFKAKRIKKPKPEKTPKKDKKKSKAKKG